MTVQWDDNVDDIITGDAAVGFAYVTPAKGVVIFPMAPMGLRDREAGTITVTSSLGLPKKIARMRENPSVAIAYHAREHGFSTRPEYVVVQGTASVPEHPDRPWLESITPEWERFLGSTSRPVARSWPQHLLLGTARDPDHGPSHPGVRRALPREGHRGAPPRGPGSTDPTQEGDGAPRPDHEDGGAHRPLAALAARLGRRRRAADGHPCDQRRRGRARRAPGSQRRSAASGWPACRAHQPHVQAPHGGPGAARPHRVARGRAQTEPCTRRTPRPATRFQRREA